MTHLAIRWPLPLKHILAAAKAIFLVCPSLAVQQQCKIIAVIAEPGGSLSNLLICWTTLQVWLQILCDHPSPLYPVWINADYFYWAQCTKCDNWLGTRNLRIMLKKQIPQIPPPSERGNVFSPSHFSDAVFVCYKKWKFAIRVIFVVKFIVT